MALALNGGGAKGAYQAGVIYGWMHEGNPDDFQWDVVSGISGGAINSCALSVWDKANGLAMSEWLSDQWTNLHTHDVWKWWPQGPIHSLKNDPSILNDTPLTEFLTNIFDQFPEGAKRYAMVGSVNANNADYESWRLDELPLESYAADAASACVSSASLPGLFIPTEINGGQFVDGGTAMGLDAMSAVEKCLELVDDDSQITMDIILLDRFSDQAEEESGDTINNLLRQHEMKHYYKGLENVITVMMAHPNVNYRYILEPSGAYPRLWNLLNFSYENTWPMQENGRADAKTALEAGPGAGFEPFLEAIRERHGQVSISDLLQK